MVVTVVGDAEMTTPHNDAPGPRQGRHFADTLVAVCAIAFIVVLAISAYWDPTIRVLHVFEALPYLMAAVLSLRQRKTGYMLGMASGGFWLWSAGTRTTFVRNGFERVAMLLRTGHVDRPDILIAAPAALVAGGMVLFSLWGYSRLRNRSWSDAGLLVAAVAGVFGFFIAIFAAFAPRYLGLFGQLFAR
jgi:hypothetical protein